MWDVRANEWNAQRRDYEKIIGLLLQQLGGRATISDICYGQYEVPWTVTHDTDNRRYVLQSVGHEHQPKEYPLVDDHPDEWGSKILK